MKNKFSLFLRVYSTTKCKIKKKWLKKSLVGEEKLSFNLGWKI